MQLVLIAIIAVLLIYILLTSKVSTPTDHQSSRHVRNPQLVYARINNTSMPQPTVPTSSVTNAVQSVCTQSNTDNSGRSLDTGIITPMLKPTLCSCVSGGELQKMVERSV